MQGVKSNRFADLEIKVGRQCAGRYERSTMCVVIVGTWQTQEHSDGLTSSAYWSEPACLSEGEQIEIRSLSLAPPRNRLASLHQKSEMSRQKTRRRETEEAIFDFNFLVISSVKYKESASTKAKTSYLLSRYRR